MTSPIIYRHGQQEGVEFLLRYKFPLLADDPGYGKTIEGIAALNRLKAVKILIICPAHIKQQWAKQLATYYFTDAPNIQIICGRDRVEITGDIVIINYEILENHKTRLRRQRYAVCILDESHKCANKEAGRTKLCLAPKTGLVHLAQRAWFITGTPIKNKPVDIFPYLKSCHPELIRGYEKYRDFAYKYAGAYDDEAGRMQLGYPNDKQQQALKGVLDQVMLRRVRPSIGCQISMLVVNPESSNQINSVIHRSQERIADMETRKVMIEDLTPAEIHAEWLETTIAKLPTVKELVNDLLDCGRKVLIGAYHREAIRLLEQLFARRCVSIYGGKTEGARKQNIRSFTTGKCDILIGQIDSMGEGLDGLQEYCSDLIFAETNYSPKAMGQFIARLNREGQKQQVYVQIPIIDGSFDQMVLNHVIKKDKIIDGIVSEEGVVINQ